MTDETLSKAELQLIDRIVGSLGLTAFRDRLWSRVKSAFHLSYHGTQLEYDFAHATPDERALKYLEDRVFILSDKTQDRLTGDLRWELLEGMRNAESIDEIKMRLDKVFAGSDVNTERIARTEILNAQNAGRLEAYVASGVVEYKQWRAAMKNPRTAADSKRLHGQVQELGNPFVDPLNGDECMHPPNRPQCRCGIIPLRKLPPIVHKNGQMYVADEVSKIEIDIGSLAKGERLIHVKASPTRKAHTRKIKVVGISQDRDLIGDKTKFKIGMVTTDYIESVENTNNYISSLNQTDEGQKVMDSVNGYTLHNYKEINNHMKIPIKTDDKLDGAITNIKKFIGGAPKYQGVVYRGLQYPTNNPEAKKRWDAFVANVESSDEIKFGSFISTSSEKGVAMQFTTSQHYGSNIRQCLVTIKTKSGVAIENLSQVKSEKEILIDNDKTYKIISFEKRDERNHFLELEEI